MINKISSYEILIKIFILSRNPEVRFVSREFYEISTLNSVRASFLLKKFGKNQVLEISNESFVYHPNLSWKQELVLKLLGSADPESFVSYPNLFRKQELVLELLERGADPILKSKQDLFSISIRRGWVYVVKYLLYDFVETTKKKFMNSVQKRMYLDGIETSVSEQKGVKYYIPVLDIHYNRGSYFRSAVSNKQADIVKQLLNAYLIKPKLNCDESKTEILTHSKVDLWGLDQKKLCDLFEQEGLDLLKLFFINGFNELSSNGSIFLEFCKRGSLKFVKFLAENGIGIGGYYNNSPLKLAYENNHFGVVKYLIKMGADTSECLNLESFLYTQNIDSEIANSPVKKEIRIIKKNKHNLQEACSNGYLNIVKDLVENGVDIHENNEIALKKASENGHLNVVKYLVEKGANIHSDQDWALGMASKSGHLDVVKYLVEKGAKVQAGENFALGIACWNKRLDIAKYLIENGADIIAETHWKQIFKDKNTHLDVVDYLLERGLKFCQKDISILLAASLKGRLDIVKCLVENGVDIHTNDDTALREAVLNGRLDVVKYLVKNGANVHAQNDYALRWASENGHLETVKCLVENGAKIRANNDEAIRLALKNKHLKLVKYLNQQENLTKNF
ncbi:hypothetical protein BB558_006006 [Smittium angustum]|uniref:Uncharacterized protein n=1 Tax=Smittium angustum TaxID=133377 RepID=A0A2U1IZ53_SMIAN|nr:hypothetical protein BB558_006006 [Smittium angustum]